MARPSPLTPLRGVARTVLTNWKTLLLFRLGASPDSLARAYRRSGTSGTKIRP